MQKLLWNKNLRFLQQWQKFHYNQSETPDWNHELQDKLCTLLDFQIHHFYLFIFFLIFLIFFFISNTNLQSIIFLFTGFYIKVQVLFLNNKLISSLIARSHCFLSSLYLISWKELGTLQTIDCAHIRLLISSYEIWSSSLFLSLLLRFVITSFSFLLSWNFDWICLLVSMTDLLDLPYFFHYHEILTICVYLFELQIYTLSNLLVFIFVITEILTDYVHLFQLQIYTTCLIYLFLFSLSLRFWLFVFICFYYRFIQLV